MMKKISKISFSALSVLILFASGTAVAQQSDYQIQQEFRTEVTELEAQINSASTVEDLEAIEEAMEAFQSKYEDHTEILNAALFPQTVSDRYDELQAQYNAQETSILTVKDLNEQISSLMEDLNEFRDQISQMDQQASELQEQIDRSAASERQQAALIRQYRQNIEQRDSFVTSFMQDLLQRYDGIDSQTRSELEEAAERLDDNPIDLIKTIIAEYTNQADQESALESQDYLAMRAQHTYFTEVWEDISDNLTEIFASDNPVQTKQEVDDMLAAWLASVNNKLWNALTTSFNQQGIELASFTDSETFYNSINSYVDSAVERSLETNNEEDYQVYRNFSDFWNNTVKAQWGDLLNDGNVLSQSQIAAIDVKLNSWGEAAAPVSNLMFILFLISLAVIIGLVVLLITKK